MPKTLTDPIVVVAEQKADTLQMIAYAIDVQAFTAKAQLVASRASVDDPTNDAARTYFAFPDKLLDRETTERVASRAGALTVIYALTQLQALGLANLTPDIIEAVQAALDVLPPVARGAYYAGTRDAFYEHL